MLVHKNSSLDDSYDFFFQDLAPFGIFDFMHVFYEDNKVHLR